MQPGLARLGLWDLGSCFLTAASSHPRPPIHHPSPLAHAKVMPRALDFLGDDGHLARPTPAPAPAPRSKKGKGGSGNNAIALNSGNNDDDDDREEEEAIAAALQKHNVKAGVRVVKNAAAKQGAKGKKSNADTLGGGSFQSMGAWRTTKALTVSPWTCTLTCFYLSAAPSLQASCHPC